jgi:hypothetical protein
MSFLFASSHLPETRVQRPQDEEEEDDVQPMQHSGGVRAFSHLPAKRVAADPAGPPSQRGVQALGPQLLRTGIQALGTPHEDGISAAKASGVFDVVRQQFNRDDSPHFMDEDGNLRPRDETRQQDSPSPRDPRSQQDGPGAPPRPAWSAAHAAGTDSSRSPRTSSPVSDDTIPWYMPPITPEDLDAQHFDDDDAVAGSHSAPKGRPELNDLVYRTPGASTPKPGLQDLVYRFNGSPEVAKDHRRDYFQNVAAPADASGHLAQQTKTYGAAPDSRGSVHPLGYADNAGSGSKPAATGTSTAADSARERLSRINPALEAAKQEVETRLAKQREIAKQADNARFVLQQNQENIESLKGLEGFLKATKFVQDKTKKRLPKPIRDLLDKVMKESGADPAAQIKNLEAKIKDSESRTAENKSAVKQAEDALLQAIEETKKAGAQLKEIEKNQNQPPAPPPQTPAQPPAEQTWQSSGRLG